MVINNVIAESSSLVDTGGQSASVVTVRATRDAGDMANSADTARANAMSFDGGGEGGGGLTGVLQDWLGSLGISSDSDAELQLNALSSRTLDTRLDAFMGQLTAALRAEGEKEASAHQQGHAHHHAHPATAATSQPYSASGRQPFSRDGLQSDLKGLVSALSHDDGSDPALASLQGSFSELMGALGVSSSDASLSGFLQNLQGRVVAGKGVGNLVDTSA